MKIANSNKDIKTCKFCRYPCAWIESNQSKETRNKESRKHFSADFDKFKTIRGFTMNTDYPKYRLREQATRYLHRFNYITGGGYGLKTYILSWRENTLSNLWPT